MLGSKKTKKKRLKLLLHEAVKELCEGASAEYIEKLPGLLGMTDKEAEAFGIPMQRGLLYKVCLEDRNSAGEAVGSTVLAKHTDVNYAISAARGFRNIYNTVVIEKWDRSCRSLLNKILESQY